MAGTNPMTVYFVVSVPLQYYVDCNYNSSGHYVKLLVTISYDELHHHHHLHDHRPLYGNELSHNDPNNECRFVLKQLMHSHTFPVV